MTLGQFTHIRLWRATKVLHATCSLLAWQDFNTDALMPSLRPFMRLLRTQQFLQAQQHME